VSEWDRYSKSRDSSVGIGTGYELDDREVGVRVPIVSRFVFSPRRPDRFLGPTHTPIQWVPGVKRSGLKTDRSALSSSEVKNT
jgi:hypothetical protein